ncbi:MAG: 2-oxoacid:acceptor oxidoreductase family protein [Candidatus Heimdallarchaeota archaeon]|nr:2-oxoacid:acceptor oxidoreductase family protein [Candidatus Heimdallarchaeota archaeon]MCK5048177.1 2-oxoacid:acceptor oxidoreductase family protein [Candidatus Heimdallarchaeota archaeon]
MAKLYDIRIHGRAGQGAVTASRLAGAAAIKEGKEVHAFPSFGPERAGAPVASFTRICDEPFTVKTEIYEPDAVVIFEHSLLSRPFVTAGLKEDTKIIVNTTMTKEEVRAKLGGVSNEIFILDANQIALEEIGREVPSTVMLGATAKITGSFSIDAFVDVTKEWFKGPIGEKNAVAIRRAAEEVQ